MNSLKVLISGASGFIGLPLVEQLSESGCEVMALSRTCIETKTTSKVQWLKADLSLPESYREEEKAFSPEIQVVSLNTIRLRVNAKNLMYAPQKITLPGQRIRFIRGFQ